MDGGYPRNSLAIRMPVGNRALAPLADNAYILRMKAPKVKSEKLPESDKFRPMILSMTGFAAVAAELPGVALAVELRSVNHRFLDLQVRLPDELRGLETTLREQILGELKRGKVECRVSLSRSAADAAGLAVDLARVARAREGGVRRDARSSGRAAVVGRRDPPLAGRAGRADALPRTSSRRTPAGSWGRRWPSCPPRAPAKAQSSSPCWWSAATPSRRRSRASRRGFPRSRRRTPKSSARACAKRGSTPTAIG